ncbi:MAG TPA: hypothetical protein VF463_11020 [Sphingobium sp.]
MSEVMAIVVGSLVLVTATVSVAAHYHREQMRQKLLRRLDHHPNWLGWGRPRR